MTKDFILQENYETVGKDSWVRRMVVGISFIIQAISILYVMFAALATGIFGLYGMIGAAFMAYVLPITQFGIPITIGITQEGINEEILRPLLIGLAVLGVITFWAGGQIRKMKKKGFIIYTGVVGILMVGTILDAINNIQLLAHAFSKPPHFLTYTVTIVFALTPVLLWYGFTNLRASKKGMQNE